MPVRTETPKLTPLARSLHAPPRQSPRTLFALATQKWLRAERLDLTQLAGELGVARTTIFRWVGTREQLYGEVISAAYAEVSAEIVRTTTGRGLRRLSRITQRTLSALVEAPALRAFLAQDPEFAIRVLTSKSSPVQARSVQREVALLQQVFREEGLRATLDLETLAFIIVRLGEAFLYADVISGRKPEIDKAVAAIRILVAGATRPMPARAGRRKPAR
ncbi:MAG: QsdR family transcriptional regulator [Polyangiales bacterium]